MNSSLIITVILALLAASSAWATITVPTSIDVPNLSRAEHRTIYDMFMKRRLYFALVTVVSIASATLFKSNPRASLTLAGGASALTVLYALVLHQMWTVTVE